MFLSGTGLALSTGDANARMAPTAVGGGAENEGIRRGTWSREEDRLLRKCVETYGEGNWHLIPQRAGLRRCRRSCRLRWVNYLSPNIKRGRFSTDEDDLILRMHRLLGNRWSLIAGRMPGRTANDIKNYWNSRLAKRVSANPAAAQLPAHPPARKAVYRPQAHRVPTKMREIYSPQDQPSLKPPSSSQPLDGTADMAEQLLIAPRPAASNLPWLFGEVESALEMGGGGESGDWLLDAELDDLFSEPFLWDWTTDDDGSSPLH